jgi:hypothetical protein
MRGTRREKAVEICATNLTNKTMCMSTNAPEYGNIQFPKRRVFYSLEYRSTKKKSKNPVILCLYTIIFFIWWGGT